LVLGTSACQVCGYPSAQQWQKYTVQDRYKFSFLALDKCLKGRDYLQVLQLNRPAKELLAPSETKKSGSVLTFEYDLDWLTVLKLTEEKLFDPQLIYKFEERKMVAINKSLVK
jgi:hypothetical protein